MGHRLFESSRRKKGSIKLETKFVIRERENAGNPSLGSPIRKAPHTTVGARFKHQRILARRADGAAATIVQGPLGSRTAEGIC
jgi:hypothetical protein